MNQSENELQTMNKFRCIVVQIRIVHFNTVKLNVRTIVLLFLTIVYMFWYEFQAVNVCANNTIQTLYVCSCIKKKKETNRRPMSFFQLLARTIRSKIICKPSYAKQFSIFPKFTIHNKR